MGQVQDATPLQIADIRAMLERRRWTALIAALSVGLLVMLLPSLVLPPLYRAEATLTAGRGIKAIDLQRDPMAGLVPDQLVSTQRELLASQEVLQNALEMSALKGNPAYAAAIDPVMLLRKRLNAMVVKGSWVINVSLDDEDPIRARGGLQAVLDAFANQQSTDHRNRSEEDLSAINRQISAVTTRLTAASKAEADFRTTHGIASINPDQNHLTTRIGNVAERLGQLDDRIAASSALIQQAQAAQQLLDPKQRQAAMLRIDTISSLTVVGILQTELFRLEGEEAELASKYLERHPRRIEIANHIAAKRSQLDETISAAQVSIEVAHTALLEQRRQLNDTMRSLQTDLNAYREQLIELQQLGRETATQQRLLDALTTQYAQTQSMANIDDRRMLVQGEPRSSPATRGIGFLPSLVLACVAGVAAGVIAASLAEAIDRNVRRTDAVVARTGLRCLGVLPADTLKMAFDGAPQHVTDALRSLAAAVRLASSDSGQAQVILVASPAGEDGCAPIAARLASAFAMSGQRTLLVDANLREPSFGALLGDGRQDGLADLLAGTPGLAPTLAIRPNLDLMPAGGMGGASADLLHSHCLPEWLTQCRTAYDVVVLTTAPIAETADALLLGNVADNLVLVVRQGSTPTIALDLAWSRLEPMRSKCLGFTALAG
jgi:polysaccharide biosynthesis transport protein